MSSSRRLAAAGTFVLAFVVNPALFSGCQASPDFGEKEVVAIVHDTASAHTYRFTNDGADYELTLDLSQVAGSDKLSRGDARPSAVRVAHACSDRTFMRSAAACLDVTTVPLEGTMLLVRTKPMPSTLVDRERVTGELRVIGTKLDSASLDLEIFSKAATSSLRGGSRTGKKLELEALNMLAGETTTPALTYRRH
jgi:hypothetical protein